MESYYKYVVDTLELFKGQISLSEIYNLTYKELGYLRKSRIPIAEQIQKSIGSLGALFG
jgi:hypothetical protein